MNVSRGRTKLIVTIIVLVATVVAVAAFVALQTRPTDSDTAQDPPTTIEEASEETPPAQDEAPSDETPEQPTIDRSKTSSIDIEPMGLTVYYVRGIPGFEFVIERTANGTEYIQFSAPELVGTKCTDDEGVFASIIKNPSETESQSLSATTKVANDTYGLSLADATCTSDPDLLKRYQTSFVDAFSLLSAMPADS